MGRVLSLFVFVCLSSCGSSSSVKPVEPGDPPLPGIAAPSTALAAELHAAMVAKGPAYRPHTRNLDASGAPLFTNRLVRETSPYLLQHAHNPMNWFAWGDEPFARAAREHKLVLVSIGYATCHWCHVMEDDSFEDAEVAAYVNANYICIKVDREERPDVDAIYMDAVVAMIGNGGWPMTVVVDDKRRPVFGATFLKKDRLLAALRQIRASDPAKLVEVAEQVQASIAGANAYAKAGKGAGVIGADAVERGARTLAARFDATSAGFGTHQKFPNAPDLSLLLRYARRTGDPKAAAMVMQTLRAMAAGGIHDQLGGGFHRYATDRAWLVPHFEKMLYDNALLAVLYLEAAQLAGGDPAFDHIARTTLDYLARDMQSPDGGFYGASDADSPDPDRAGARAEGRFFTWTAAELDAALGPDDGAFARAYFHVDDPAARVDGRSILHLASPSPPPPPPATIGGSTTPPPSPATIGRSPPSPATPIATGGSAPPPIGRSTPPPTQPIAADADAARLAAIVPKLLAIRAQRPPPPRDDKVIASWNGLAISAFAKGGFALHEPRFIATAEKTAALVLGKLRAADGKGLARSWRENQATGVATLTDYASIIAGLLDLLAADHDLRWLAAARDLSAEVEARFADPAGGAYFMTESGRETLVRIQPIEDSAELSPNALLALDYLRLAELTGDDAYRTRVENIFGTATALLATRSDAAGMRAALEAYLDAPFEIAIVVPDNTRTDLVAPALTNASPAEAEAAALIDEVRRAYLPSSILAIVPESRTHDLPFLDGKAALDHRPTAFVCIRTTCREPTHDPHTLATQLARTAPLYPDRSPAPL